MITYSRQVDQVETLLAIHHGEGIARCTAAGMVDERFDHRTIRRGASHSLEDTSLSGRTIFRIFRQGVTGSGHENAEFGSPAA